ncbi:LOW QUALITY PROTEIN: hypothetical protein YC2023_030229 [Brassica napus]
MSQAQTTTEARLHKKLIQAQKRTGNRQELNGPSAQLRNRTTQTASASRRLARHVDLLLSRVTWRHRLNLTAPPESRRNKHHRKPSSNEPIASLHRHVITPERSIESRDLLRLYILQTLDTRPGNPLFLSLRAVTSPENFIFYPVLNHSDPTSPLTTTTPDLIQIEPKKPLPKETRVPKRQRGALLASALRNQKPAKANLTETPFPEARAGDGGSAEASTSRKNTTSEHANRSLSPPKTSQRTRRYSNSAPPLKKEPVSELGQGERYQDSEERTKGNHSDKLKRTPAPARTLTRRPAD